MIRRDKALTIEQLYLDPDSYMRSDGTEVLFREDWARRKVELYERCGGRCEHVDTKCSENLVGSVRCCHEATEPHHEIRRSIKRIDNLWNLKGLCHVHHAILDYRKVRSDKRGRREAILGEGKR